MKKYQTLKYTGYLEALSYILLLGIAMPLKHVWNQPEMVKYTGWAHGVLFVTYLAVLVYYGLKYSWPFKFYFYGFVASLLPMGPLVFDRKVLER